MFKRIVVWDLDETIVDSAHRTPNHDDGTLNLSKYFELKTRENIMRDTFHPLVRVFNSLNREENYVVICTARTVNQDDLDFLAANNLHYHSIRYRPSTGKMAMAKDSHLKTMHLRRLMALRQFRGLPVVMFDDAKPVIAAMRKIGIVCLNAVKVNARLA